MPSFSQLAAALEHTTLQLGLYAATGDTATHDLIRANRRLLNSRSNESLPAAEFYRLKLQRHCRHLTVRDVLEIKAAPHITNAMISRFKMGADVLRRIQRSPLVRRR